MLPNDAVYPRHSLLVVAKDGDGLVDNVLLPDGEVDSSKGTFVVDEGSWKELKLEFDKRGEIVIDFEHQSMGGDYQAPSGKAPAAGWIKKLRYEKGIGVIASVQWNPEARALIKSDEYKYWSPAIRVDKKHRKAVELLSAGLTNTPAIYDMPALAAKDGPQETDMSKTVELKPDKGLRSIVLALQDDGELPQFPAITADQQMVTRLLDLLKSKGVALDDEAPLAEVLSGAIELIEKLDGAEGGEEGGGEGGEGEATAEAESALRAELGIDEDGDIMEKVKELKAEQAALVLKNSAGEDTAARLKVLEDEKAARTAEHHKTLIAKAVDANKINPNDKPAMEAAELVLKAQGEEKFTALMGGLNSYVEPGQTVTAGADAAARDARSKLITLTAKEWEGDASRGTAKCSTYVNVALADEDHKGLTDAEAAKLDGKDGE